MTALANIAQIQRNIVRHIGNDRCIPNVSGFFGGTIECDLLAVSGDDCLHEYEIKRSWSDFLADFRKSRFHDDVRICRLTFVLPKSMASDRLRHFCEDNYDKFRREFGFLFYDDDTGVIVPKEKYHQSKSGFVSLWTDYPPQYRTETYITSEMLEVIRDNDAARPYRRKLFHEELCKLYRVGCVKLWHRSDLAKEVGRD